VPIPTGSLSGTSPWVKTRRDRVWTDLASLTSVQSATQFDPEDAFGTVSGVG